MIVSEAQKTITRIKTIQAFLETIDRNYVNPNQEQALFAAQNFLSDYINLLTAAIGAAPLFAFLEPDSNNKKEERK